MSLIPLVVASLLFATGTYLVLQRSLAKVIIGLGVVSHGANLLIVLSSASGGSPPVLSDGVDPATVSDPLPQAMVLTAIVITFGVTAFLLALGYRSWQINRDDRVEDDVEDRLVARSDEPDPDAAIRADAVDATMVEPDRGGRR